MSCTGYLGTLFQKPHKWTTRHRDVLQVEEDQVSSERIVGFAYMPHDGDQEFEAIAADFTRPRKEDFLQDTIWFDSSYTKSPFWSVFSRLGQMMRLEEKAETDDLGSDYFRLSKLIMESLFDILLGLVHLHTGFVTLLDSKIRFHIHSCSVQGVLRSTGALSRCSDIENNKITLPVATFSAINPHKNTDIISHEIPQVLIQAILMSQKNPALETHTTFALRIEGTKLQLSSASISQAYIHNLSHGNPLVGGLTLLHSAPYDLWEPEQRREILRMFIGLLRHLDAAQANC